MKVGQLCGLNFLSIKNAINQDSVYIKSIILTHLKVGQQFVQLKMVRVFRYFDANYGQKGGN